MFQISRRNTSEEIATVSELFDFEETVWDGNKILDFGSGMVFYRDFHLNSNGGWWASEYGGIWGIGVTGSGEILSYSAYTPELSSRKIDIVRRKEFIDVLHYAAPGGSQQLQTSSDLSDWFEVTNVWTYVLDGHSSVSSGGCALVKSYRLDEMPSSVFFRVVSP